MEKNSVAEALRTLTGEKKSDAARLREVFFEVEAALSAGVSRAAILETLCAQGFTMTARSFESAMYRIRKKNNAGKLDKPGIVREYESISTKTTAATPQVFTPSEKPEISEDQADDDSTLTTKQRRERRAAKFVKIDSPTDNPLLQSILKKERAK